MSKIRVDAEPLFLLDKERGPSYLPVGTVFQMPRIHGMEVDGAHRVLDRLTQPARLRRNPRDERGSYYHLRLTRHEVFTVMVPVILAEINPETL